MAIVGGGSCALMLASMLDPEKFTVHIYEKNAAPGRKFLVAGDGGLNLTHSEPAAGFISRYTPPSFLERAFDRFSNTDFIQWLNGAGIETFVGTSGRVFPTKGTKPVEVLNTLLDKLKHTGATIHTRHEWKGFSAHGDLVFHNGGQEHTVKSDVVVFCLGGASWPVTGSTGNWLSYFEEKKIATRPFEASNCSFKIDWPADMISSIEGRALKNCSIRCGEKKINGEVVLTAFGIEGSGIYPLSPLIRQQLAEKKGAAIFIDLKPALSPESVVEKLSKPAKGISYTAHVARQLNLKPVHLALLKTYLQKETFLNPSTLAAALKNLELVITATGPLEDAISTVGGISLEEVDTNFELKKWPGNFVIGEMLDYDAPTGGYLLQSCFTMAGHVAGYLNGL